MPRVKFSKASIKDIEKNIHKLVTDRMDSVAIDVHNILSVETPKDTGVAARAWNFTLNKKDFSVPKKPPKGTQLSPQPSVPDKKAKKLTDRYHLTNATPYIIPLNEGHSQKVDPNFIERAMVTGNKAAK